MSGNLSHEPNEIIRQLLIDASLGTTTGDWTTYLAREPDSPDSALTVYNSPSVPQGRLMPTGDTQKHYGFTIRVRAQRQSAADNKARAIALHFDRTVNRTQVTLGDYTYVVQSISLDAHPVSLGRESPQSNRRIVNINATADIFLLSSAGTGTA